MKQKLCPQLRACAGAMPLVIQNGEDCRKEEDEDVAWEELNLLLCHRFVK